VPTATAALVTSLGVVVAYAAMVPVPLLAGQ
jgi:hypothetical protein